jgi:hypothetical protein
LNKKALEYLLKKTYTIVSYSSSASLTDTDMSLIDGSLISTARLTLLPVQFPSGSIRQREATLDTNQRVILKRFCDGPSSTNWIPNDDSLKKCFLTYRFLSHENLCRFFGFHYSDPNYFIISERGKDNLQQLIATQKLSEEEKKRVALDIARGLNYMHKLDFVHGNLKTENCVVVTTSTYNYNNFLR